MRYIGSKNKLLTEIDSLLEKKKLKKQGLVFFDAFSGTSVVGQNYKDLYKIIANDNLTFAAIIADAKLNAPSDMFRTLGFDPFCYFNNNVCQCDGFISQNYAPKLSSRMYFSAENASKIDYIRTTIQTWYDEHKIDEHEKNYLIASLLESLSKVANIAGVYGSYLKTWDPRAVKPMQFFKIDDNPHVTNNAQVFNEDILKLINKVSGDIIYIDPPYTKNQYSVQYHMLETVAKYDSPVLNGKTGARNMADKSSVFSKPGEVEKAFEYLIAHANFKHIIVSYSTDGLMSKDYIENVLRRYGKTETLDVVDINYQRYLNAKADDKENHREFLFYIKKKDDVQYASPLNFIGGKGDLISFIRANLPNDIDAFYDLFGGGFNVGINVINANKIVYNDINFKVKELLEYITKCNVAEFIVYIRKQISKYGLEKGNKDNYISFRDYYNAQPIDKRDVRDLFILIMFGFQQQIRFNSKYDYNNPVGQAGFNDKVLEKLVSFARITNEMNAVYYSIDYSLFFDKINKEDFVYIDPPYLITLGSYNDGKRGFNGWNEKEEKRLYAFLDKLDRHNIRFMLSNVLIHNGKENKLLSEWLDKNRQYKVVEYDKLVKGDRRELLIVNY